MLRSFFRLTSGVLIWSVGAMSIPAQDSPMASVQQSAEFYASDIQPLLKTKCFACHSALKQEAELRLDTRDLMHSGGTSGTSVLSGGEASLLMQRITAQDDTRMPPPHEGSALRADEIDKIQRWLNAGAIAPEEEVPQRPSEHWAFQPIAIDEVIQRTFSLRQSDMAQQADYQHPVDLLVHQQRAEAKLKPARPVERRRLIRRLYLDLIGLPPTLAQLEDQRPVEVIVDELLASPLYGQRWGRHWMDIWRYTDWYGLGDQLRNSQKHIWHWRDWIVDSLNADKGYDRMILEMLAGDELEPENQEAVAGTGFLARNYYLFNRTTWLDDTIEHTSKAFLGLTLNCCKCHDHKYDPLTQKDYYNFRAIFEPHQVRLDPLPGGADLEQNGLPRVFDDQLEAKTYLHRRGDPAQPDLETTIVPQIPALFASAQPAIQPVSLPISAYAPGTREYARHAVQQAAQQRIEQALQQLQAAQSLGEDQAAAVALAEANLNVAQQALKSVQAKIKADDLQFGLVEGDSESAIHNAQREELQLQLAEANLQLLQAGDKPDIKQSATEKIQQISQKLSMDRPDDARYVGLKVSRKALETPEHTDQNYPVSYSTVSSGRRLALARWITSSRNPLTARVAVNHIWMRHFGQPLVENVYDFGLRTKKPRQAELLDYLAAEFMQSGWSMKVLHRLLLTSQLYCLGDVHYSQDVHGTEHDPNNEYWWRGSVRRMESQIIRDCILNLAGQLDTSLGGPSTVVGPDSRRRSLYFNHSPEDQDQFLSQFDDADLLQCYRRSESIVPQQALALANSKLTIEMSSLIAQRVTDALPRPDDRSQFVEIAFLTILGRQPSAMETEVCLEFFEAQVAQPAESKESDRTQRAGQRLVLGLLNHNDFVTIR